MENFVDGVWERIKSPFFGYLSLAFLALNWRPLFFLFFSDMSPFEKFYYFDTTTDYLRLLVWPVLIALTVMWANAWLQVGVTKYLLKKPNQMINAEQVRSEQETLTLKAELEAARAKLKAVRESEVVAEGEVNARVQQIPDEEVRKRTEIALENLRAELSGTAPMNSASLAERVKALNPKELSALSVIRSKGPITALAGAREMNTDSITFTFLAKELESRGLVAFKHDCWYLPDIVSQMLNVTPT